MQTISENEGYVARILNTAASDVPILMSFISGLCKNDAHHELTLLLLSAAYLGTSNIKSGVGAEDIKNHLLAAFSEIIDTSQAINERLHKLHVEARGTHAS